MNVDIKVKLILGDDYTEQQSKCPGGDEGLECRRKEARNGAESCYGGKSIGAIRHRNTV